jgi:tetratricopeptide (TPR) repeat protein
MPSHIFLQLGMWPEAAASNEAAWAASEKWASEQKSHGAMKDIHSLQWLMYVYLQQGRYGQAENLLARMRETLPQAGPDAGSHDKFHQLHAMSTYSNMAAAFVIETERWDQAPKFAQQLKDAMPQTRSRQAPDADGKKQGGGGEEMLAFVRAPLSFASALAAAMNGAKTDDHVADLDTVMRQPAVPVEALAMMPKIAGLQKLEIEAIRSAVAGRFDEAIAGMKKAIAAEESIPAGPLGPPMEIKPVYELFGEILLRAGKAIEARQQFAISLRRHPNRARSLLGYARASAKAGDAQAASETYSGLAQQWKGADADTSEISEARKEAKGLTR